MRRAWVGISAAAACAAMATILLFVGNLEMLSWIAGAGSFIIAVPSLVIALTAQSRTTGGSTTRPNRETGTGGSGQVHRPDTGTDTAAGNPGSVLVELTTPRIRTANRLSNAAKNAGYGFALIAVVFTGRVMFTGDDSQVERFLLAGLFVAALLAPFGWWDGADGKDLLIVNDEGLTIVDKRRMRARDASFTIPWPLMEHVRLASSTKGAFHVLIVKFRYAKSDTEASQISALEKRGDYSLDGHIMARLYLASGGTERTELLFRARTALADFGGNYYAE